MSHKKEIGNKLRQHRLRIGLTLEEYVRVINAAAPRDVRTNLKNFSKYEQGTNRCPLELWLKIERMRASGRFGGEGRE